MSSSRICVDVVDRRLVGCGDGGSDLEVHDGIPVDSELCRSMTVLVGLRSERRTASWYDAVGRCQPSAGPRVVPPSDEPDGTQLGGRFSMKARMPSLGSGEFPSAQNIVW